MAAPRRTAVGALSRLAAGIRAPASSILRTDKQKYTACSLMAYPLSILYRQLPDRPILKHLYGLTLGLAFCYYLTGFQLLHHLVTATAVYWAVERLPPSYSSYAVLALSLAYLALCHLYRIYTDYLNWSIDFTGTQMLLTIKFVMYAFDRCDLALPPSTPSTPAQAQLAAYVGRTKLLRKPSPLEYYSYMFWYSSVLAGPTLPLRTHLEFIDLSMFPDRRVPPGSYRRGLLLGLYALSMSLPLLLQSRFPIHRLADGSLHHIPVPYRAFYLWISVLLCRFPYYFAWLSAEGANIILGLGWAGPSDSSGSSGSLWDRASSVRVLAFETSRNFKDITDNWNINANRWLKYYVYLRVKDQLGSYATFLAYLVSSIWHGLYPGYYFSFGLSAFATEFYREVYRKVRVRFLDSSGRESLPYRLVLTALTSYLLSYALVAFVLLSWERSVAAYASLGWHGHIFLILGLAALKLVPGSTKRKAL